MAHCPYCGTKTNENEKYCIHCGKALPEDFEERAQGPQKKSFNRWWILPISVFILSVLALSITYLTIEQKTTQAQEQFKRGEQLALEGQYNKARNYFDEALELSYQFPAAYENKQFMKVALTVQSLMKEAKQQRDDEEFQLALKKIEDAEKKLKNYNGDVVNKLVEAIVKERNQTKVLQLKHLLSNEPSIDNLKMLLWQAEAIQNAEGKKIASQIKERIVSHAFSTANEELKEKHFTKARQIVEDGLRYAPNSKKLQSMKTTIEKEKAAFETAQQNRIEQAMIAAEKEREKNRKDAVEIVDVTTTLDEYGGLIVKGQIKSVATVPINSVSIHYNLLNEEDEVILSNDVYTYPDTLYPDEKGKFEFTHYDVNTLLDVKIAKVTWFLD